MSEVPQLLCVVGATESKDQYSLAVFLEDGYVLMQGTDYESPRACRDAVVAHLLDAFKDFLRETGMAVTPFVRPYRDGDHIESFDEDIKEIFGPEFKAGVMWKQQVPFPLYERLLKYEEAHGLKVKEKEVEKRSHRIEEPEPEVEAAPPHVIEEEDDGLITQAMAARIMGVSRQNVCRMVKNGALEFKVRAGQKWVVKSSITKLPRKRRKDAKGKVVA